MNNLQKRRLQMTQMDDGDDPEFQIAPMADVLFVLLVFFISITTTEVLQKVQNVELPHAQQSNESKKKSNQVVVNVAYLKDNKKSKIIVDEKSYAAATDLVPMFRQRLAANAQVRVLIRADRNIEYSTISDIMRACSQAQIGNVTFSVLQGGNGGAKASAPAGGT